MNEYSRKMIRVSTTNLLREQDVDKLPVLDVRNLGIDFGGLTAVDGFNITIVHVQPRDQCMMSQVISAGLIT